jgi:hypothetical protein
MSNSNQVQSNRNNFFGVKVSKPGFNVNNASDAQLVYKTDYSTQTWFDGSGNPVIIQGLQPNGSYGITLNNATITLNNTDTNTTTGLIEVTNNGITQILIGILPDGTAGMAISKPGIDVFSAFS